PRSSPGRRRRRRQGGRGVMAASTAAAPVAPATPPEQPARPAPTRRKLTGYWLLLPGALWLVVFFVIPLYSLVATSLYDPDGSVLQGYDMTWAFSTYWHRL